MDLKTPDTKSLQSLPYSELKKLAKSKGIKSNMKAEKLIAALTAADSDDSESFLTPAAQVLNSCSKNKEAKFNVDKMTPLVTPRRGTYSLETPASVKAEDIPEITDEKTCALDESNVTIERGSERKLRSRKVSFLSPVRTPQTPKNSSLRLRPKTPVASFTSLCEQVSPSPVASARKNKDRKDSFCVEATPKQQLFPSGENDNAAPTPGTKNASLKRKSTLLDGLPASATKSISLKRKSATLDDREPGTESSIKKRKSSVYGGSTRSSVSQCDSDAKKKALATPSSSAKATHLQPQQSLKKENALTPRPTKSLGFVEDSAAKRKLLATPDVKPVSGTAISSKKRSSTPGSTRSSVSRCDSAAKKKALATPNFKKIHARAFEKLESIDEYQKRMEESAKKIKKAAPKVTRATTKIATFGGISFVPSVRPSALKPKLNISTNKNSGAAARSFLSQAETAAKKKSAATPTAARSFLSQAETAAKKKSVATPTPIQSKTDAENSMKKKKFDLKASLSRKLGYKPYTGPLKPLAESNKLDTSMSCLHKPKESENIIVKQKRLQNRTALKGVRTNKRFELQMKNRQLV